ncbi:PDDEXK-like uncharacterized protein DUF3799 [Dysgonomonas alginatilytica]|uniref:PDDEXK-like uncharacterized protein DUF3799 n=1 Tax=Dysgonomonas alginatilytica TaxID=1605892 RepID=A0A2V3PS73_9BACT|nr:PD-(D/E)XK nuclease-like domain-containing protein [Dysgonomonas alginatilytica]PXV61207.1 PDDEXK-like uncharacterized protein DUF3799 [Dysgonomonas alginatilytica]
MDIRDLLDDEDLDGLDFSSLQTLNRMQNISAGIELDYDKGSYPPLETMLDFIRVNWDKKSVNIDPESLSVNGICVQDDMQTYLDSPCISSGNKKEALKSPLAFLVNYEEKLPAKSGKHFELGTFAHLAFLEPSLFEKVIVAPDCNLVYKEGVIQMINFYRELEGKENAVFSKDRKIDDLRKILQAYQDRCNHQIIQPEHKVIIDLIKHHYYTYGNGIISRILKGALVEVSMYGKETNGLDVRIRPDAINLKENIGVDAIISFKTSRADTLSKFYYDCAKLQYEVSEGMYQDVATSVTGRNFNVTIMIMLQTVPPYQPAVIWWDPDDIEIGKYKSNLASSIILESMENKYYPGFDIKAESGNYGIIKGKLPLWAGKEELPTASE